ncbi:MAG: phosphonate transport system substrate-binding protein [Comamonadaceae bacterium]|nr:MAG: phosphonate transport system substrate-binding protein [Comamonadaceae bacterium]
MGGVKSLGHLFRLISLLLAMVLVACKPTPHDEPLQYSNSNPASIPVYRFAVHPLHNPQKLMAVYQPLMDHLNSQLTNARLELEASRDYQAFEQKYAAREPAFLLPNPWQTLQAMKLGYHVMAMAGDAQDFRGIFLVRKDSPIRNPADLKGKVVSYPSYTALAAAIMPQYFLHTHGIDVMRDIQNVYVGSQESSILNVYMGRAAAGATWPPPWRLFQQDHPTEAAALRVIWETEPLLNNSVMVRDDVPAAVRDQVKRSLLNLASTPAGSAILSGMATARFHASDDASYDVVAQYVKQFEKAVRPVERP